MKTFKFAVAALAGMELTNAFEITNPTLAEAATYPEWSFVMQQWIEEYAWKPLEVTTDDGYVLTMFKVTQRFSECESTSSVLFDHGYGFDSTDSIGAWNQLYPGVRNHLFELVDDCYDVYFSNYRGTRYSLAHTNEDPEYNKSQAYWNFSYAELGLFDFPAFMDKIYEDNGGKKMYIINESLGTTITHYALAQNFEESYFVDRLEKIIQLAPCPGVV